MFNKDYSLKGKHADYMRLLVASTEGSIAKIFDYGYQVLFIAPLIGAAYNLKPEIDENNNMDFTIKAIQMIKNKNKLEEVYRMILLADRSIGSSPDKRVNFVFRPEKDEKEKADELFNSYLRGGVEWLYNNIIKDGGTPDDYLNNMISAIGDYIMDFGVYEDIENEINESEEAYFN